MIKKFRIMHLSCRFGQQREIMLTQIKKCFHKEDIMFLICIAGILIISPAFFIRNYYAVFLLRY